MLQPVRALDAEEEASPALAADGGRAAWSPVRLAILTLLVVLIALMQRQGGLAAEDATVLLNARNGLAQSPILFFYAGYAALVPDLVSWLVSPLPLAGQGLAYMATAVAAGVLCGEEAWRLVRLFHGPAVAWGATILLLWLIHSQSGLVFLNLTYVIWPALVWGALRLARAAVEGRAPGWGETALLLAFGASQPLTIAWAPAILWLAWRERGAARWRMAGLLGLILVWTLLNLALAPHATAGVIPMAEAWGRFLADEPRQGWRDLLIHVLALACLAGAAVLAVRAARMRMALDPRDMALLHLLVFAALATALYFASDRFLLYRSFVERYGVPALAAAALCAVIWLGGRLRGRAVWIATALLCLLPAVGLARGHLFRQAGEVGGRIAFLNAADAWRRTGCGAGPGAMAQDPKDRWSLALPCTRRTAPPTSGFYALHPQGGLTFSADMSLDTAGVYVGKPLIGR